MASDPSLGFVLTRQNAHVQVVRKDDGGVSLVDLRTLAALDFDAAERDQLRELLDRAAMPGQAVPCAYCEDDPDHPDPDNAGTCTCASPGCGRGWCPQRDDLAATPGQASG